MFNDTPLISELIQIMINCNINHFVLNGSAVYAYSYLIFRKKLGISQVNPVDTPIIENMFTEMGSDRKAEAL